MKLLELHLQAFGPFAEQTLTFRTRPQAIQLIYGPNEAGKSSSLRALSSFLFGFPRQTPDAHRFPIDQLRIGGIIESAAGEQHHWVRRRGGKNSLRHADDRKIADDAPLRQMLGGIDRDQFLLRFGLDYEQLVRGGEAMAAGEGELGELLFAAASGLGNVHAVQQQLQNQADELFRARGSKQKLAELLRELQESRAEVQRISLGAETWQRIQDDQRTVQTRLQQVQHERRELERQVDQHESLLAGKKLVPRWLELSRQAESLQEVPALDDDWCARRKAAQQRALEWEVRWRELEKTRPDQDNPAARRELDVDVVSCLPLARTLADQQSAVVQRAQDRSEAQRSRQVLHDELVRRLEALGHPAAASLDAWQPLPAGATQRIQELATEQAQLEARRRDLSLRLDDLESQRGRIESEVEEVAAEPPRGLRELCDQVADEADLDQRWLQACETHAQSQLEWDHAWQQWQAWSGEPAALLGATLPNESEVQRRLSEFREGKARDRALVEETQRCVELRRDAQTELEALQSEGELPSRDAWLELRRQRDELWTGELKPFLLDPQEHQESLKINRLHGQIFENLLQQLDQVTEQWIRQADRVAKQESLQRTGRQLEERLEVLQQQQQQRQADVAAWWEAWRALWPPECVLPTEPETMLAWRSEALELRERRSQLEQQRLQIQQLEQRREQALASLQRELTAAGVDEQPRDPSSVKSWLRLAREVRDRLDAAATRRQRQLERLRELAEEQASDQRRLQQLEQQLEDWQAAWSATLESLGLASDLRPDAAVAQVNELGKVDQTLGEYRRLQQTLEQSREADDGLRAELQRLATHVPGLDPQGELAEALLELNRWVAETQREVEAVEAARLKQQQWDEQAEQLAELHRDLQVEWETLCQQADRDEGGQVSSAALSDLHDLEERWRQARDVQRQWAELRERLWELAGDVDLSSFVERAEQATDVELQDALDRDQHRLQRLAEEHDQLLQRRGEIENALKQMDGNDAAAAAQERVEDLLARISEATTQFARLTLASSLLQRAIQSYREQHQGPILEHASRYFQTLTCGVYGGLMPDFDEKGRTILLGVRDGGEALRIEQMSEGTRDQLYLALRLASLRDYLQQHEPIPFVIDDVLIKFDDQRTTAALEVFADLAASTQVILFTHHQHLIELARAALPTEAWHLHELGAAT